MPKKRKQPAERCLFETAVEKGDLVAIQRLIKSGLKPSATAAETATEACNNAFTKAHQTKKFLFHRKPSRKQTEQAAVTAENYYKITTALLKAGAPASEAELCSAARNGNTGLALLLINSGADVNYEPMMGPPLENAVKSGSLKVVQALLQAGADVHHQDLMGTLLMQAISAGHPVVADELIKAGIDVNAQAASGSTALLEAVTKRKLDLVKKLLAAGADVNGKGEVTCGERGEPEVEEEDGMRTTHIPDAPVAYESTPLIVAVRRGYAEVAARLLKAGADLEATDRDGFTALVHATKSNHQELIRLLQDAGARSPRHAEGSPEAAFMAAAQRGDCENLQSLLAEGLDVNLKRGTDEEAERTALIHAVESGHSEAVRLLLRSGANVDEECGRGWGEAHNRTALMHAAKAGHVEIICILVEAGASVAAKDREMEGGGRTALHYAAEAGQAEAIRALVKAGAKVDAKSKSGETALMAAAGGGHTEAPI